jgi:hypothetical protein
VRVDVDENDVARGLILVTGPPSLQTRLIPNGSAVATSQLGPGHRSRLRKIAKWSIIAQFSPCSSSSLTSALPDRVKPLDPTFDSNMLGSPSAEAQPEPH